MEKENSDPGKEAIIKAGINEKFTGKRIEM